MVDCSNKFSYQIRHKTYVHAVHLCGMSVALFLRQIYNNKPADVLVPLCDVEMLVLHTTKWTRLFSAFSIIL